MDSQDPSEASGLVEGLGKDSPSQSQPCGEASAGAEVFAGLGAEPSAAAMTLLGLTDIFERPFDGEDDPRIRLARCVTRREAEAILEYRGDLTALESPDGEAGDALAPWQPIETAPRDGTHILGLQAGSSFGWRDMKPLPEVQTVVHWFPDPEEPGFYTSVNEMEPQHPFAATHWKPLEALRAATASPAEASGSWEPAQTTPGDEVKLWAVVAYPGSRVSDLWIGGHKVQVPNDALKTSWAFANLHSPASLERAIDEYDRAMREEVIPAIDREQQEQALMATRLRLGLCAAPASPAEQSVLPRETPQEPSDAGLVELCENLTRWARITAAESVNRISPDETLFAQAASTIERLTRALEKIKDKAEFGQRGQFRIISAIASAALSDPAHRYQGAERAGGWRPIESAPRDGTRVLTFSPKAPEHSQASIRENYFRRGAWGLTNERHWPPTHWQPLPTPPNSGEEGLEGVRVSVADIARTGPAARPETSSTPVGKEG